MGSIFSQYVIFVKLSQFYKEVIEQIISMELILNNWNVQDKK